MPAVTALLHKKSRDPVPDTVREIGDYAFENAGSLQGILLPDGLERIGDNAFHDCRELTELTF